MRISWLILSGALIVSSTCGKQPASSENTAFVSVNSVRSLDTEFDSQQLVPNKENTIHRIAEFTDMTIIDGQNMVAKQFVEIGGCEDDSLFLTAYTNNIVLYSNVGITYFFVGNFPATSNGIYRGQTLEDVQKLLGIPYRKTSNILTYQCLDEFLLNEQDEHEEYEAVRLYFINGKLTAIQIVDRGTC